MLKIFAKYAWVGILNTIIHWGVFCLFVYCYSFTQATSNFLGFIVAVTFSFFMNAKFTFNSTVTTERYVLYVSFMGFLSIVVGAYSDSFNISPIFTLVSFSMISLCCGFVYSKFIVFRNSK